MFEQVPSNTTVTRVRTKDGYIHRLLSINLFDEPEREVEAAGELLQHQLHSTRLYILLVTLALSIIVFLTCLDQKWIQHTASVSLLEDFEVLENKYGDTLLCPCEQVSIPYPNMMLLTPTFHQVRENSSMNNS